MKTRIVSLLLSLLMVASSAMGQTKGRVRPLIQYKAVPVETEGDAYTEVTVSYIQPALIPAQFEVRFSIWQEEDCLHPTIKVENGKGIDVDWNRLKCVLLNVDKEQPEPVGGYSMDTERFRVLPYYAVRRTNKQPFKVRFSPDAFTPKVKGDIMQFMAARQLKSFCAHTFLRVDIYDLCDTLITDRPTTNPPAASSCWDADGWIPSSVQEQDGWFILGDMGNGPALGPVKLGWKLEDVPKRVEGLYDRWERRVEKENDPAVEEADRREWVTIHYYKDSKPILVSNVIDGRITCFDVLPTNHSNIMTTLGVHIGSSVDDYQKRFYNPSWVVSLEEGKAETYYQDDFTFTTDLKYSYSKVEGANVTKFKPNAVINGIEYHPNPEKLKNVPAPPRKLGNYNESYSTNGQLTPNLRPENNGQKKDNVKKDDNKQPKGNGNEDGKTKKTSKTSEDDGCNLPTNQDDPSDTPKEIIGQPEPQPEPTPIPVPEPDPVPDTIHVVVHHSNVFNIFEFAQRMLVQDDYKLTKKQVKEKGFEITDDQKIVFFSTHKAQKHSFSAIRMTSNDNTIWSLSIGLNTMEDEAIAKQLEQLGYVQTKSEQKTEQNRPVSTYSYQHQSGKYVAKFIKKEDTYWVSRTVEFQKADKRL